MNQPERPRRLAWPAPGSDLSNPTDLSGPPRDGAAYTMEDGLAAIDAEGSQMTPPELTEARRTAADRPHSIYVASSWRCPHQPAVVEALRATGLSVYDFRNPRPGDEGFHWSEIDPHWTGWDTEQFCRGLLHPIAQAGFASDMNALRAAEAIVLVLPCGRSAHLEAGWAAGAGKPVFVYAPYACEPELMYLMAQAIHWSLEDLVQNVIASLAERSGDPC